MTSIRNIDMANQKRPITILFIISIWIFTALFIYRNAVILPFVQDDWYFIERVSKVTSIYDLVDLFLRNDHFYRPIPRVLVLGIYYYLFGNNSTVFHIMNILLHVVNSLLLMKLISSIKKSLTISIIASWLFLIHSCIYMAVTWISGIQELMLVNGFLLSMLCYSKYDDNKKKRWYVLSLLFGVIALLSKESGILLPLWITGLLFLKKRKFNLKYMKDIIGFISIVIIYLIIHTLKASVDPATGPYKITTNVITISLNIIRYISSAFEIYRSIGESGLPYIGAICIFIFFISYKYISSSAKVGALWFILGLTPVVILNSHQESYYLMLPLVGWSIIIAELINKIIFLVYKKTNNTPLTSIILSLIMIITTYYFIYNHSIRYKIDEGGLIAKSKMCIDGKNFLYKELENYDSNSITIGNVDLRTSAAWGNGAMIRFLYPDIKNVILVQDTIDYNKEKGFLNINRK